MQIGPGNQENIPLPPSEIKLSGSQRIKSALSGSVGKLSTKIKAVQQAITKEETSLNKLNTQLRLTGVLPDDAMSKIETTLNSLNNQAKELSDALAKLPPNNNKTPMMRQQLLQIRQNITTLTTQKAKIFQLKQHSAIFEKRNEILKLCKKAIKNPQSARSSLEEATTKAKQLHELKNIPEDLKTFIDEAKNTLAATCKNVLDTNEFTVADGFAIRYFPTKFEKPETNDHKATLPASLEKPNSSRKATTLILSPFERLSHKHVAASAKNIENVATAVVQTKKTIANLLSEKPEQNKNEIIENLRSSLTQAKFRLQHERNYLSDRTRSTSSDKAQNSILKWETEIQTLEQKINLLEALSSEDFVAIHQSTETAYDHLSQAYTLHKHNNSLFASIQLHHAATEFENLSTKRSTSTDNYSQDTFSQYKDELITKLKSTLDDAQSTLLTLTPDESTLKEKVLSNKQPEEDEMKSLQPLLTKSLVQQLHFSDGGGNVDLDRLIELCRTNSKLQIAEPFNNLVLGELLSEYKTKSGFNYRETAVQQGNDFKMLLDNIQNSTTPIETRAYDFQRAIDLFSEFVPGNDPELKNIQTSMKKQKDAMIEKANFMSTDLDEFKKLKRSGIPKVGPDGKFEKNHSSQIKLVTSYLSAEIAKLIYRPDSLTLSSESINQLFDQLKVHPVIQQEVLIELASNSEHLYNEFANALVFHNTELAAALFSEATQENAPPAATLIAPTAKLFNSVKDLAKELNELLTPPINDVNAQLLDLKLAKFETEYTNLKASLPEAAQKALQPAYFGLSQIMDLRDTLYQTDWVRQQVQTAITTLPTTGSQQEFINALKEAPSHITPSKMPTMLRKALVSRTDEEQNAFANKIPDKDQQAKLLISLWKKLLIDLAPNYHAKSDEHIPDLQGILDRLKGLGMKDHPEVVALLGAQRALEIEPKLKQPSVLGQICMQKFGELHGNIKQKIFEVEDIAKLPISAESKTQATKCANLLKTTLANLNKQANLENIDAQYDAARQINEHLPFGKIYTDAYKGKTGIQQDCCEVLNTQEFRDLTSGLSELLRMLAQETSNTSIVSTPQQMIGNFLTSTLENLVKELLQNTPSGANQRPQLLDAYNLIKETNANISA